MARPCPFCDVDLRGEDLHSFGLSGLAHIRTEHPENTFPDMAIRDYLEGEARMTGGTERLVSIGAVEVHPVTEDRIDDWLSFFDHDAHAGQPRNASCYCLEPHEVTPGEPLPEFGRWTQRRAVMVDRLRKGSTFGYLAYVDGRPVGWINASMRCDYTLFRRGDPADDETVGIACFVIAPPYRGHGIAQRLLDRVVADAARRSATAVEAYPLNERPTSFRGSRVLFDRAGCTEVKVRSRDTVVQRPAAPLA